MEFRSNSELLKYYIRKILSDGQPHLRKDIIARIEKELERKDFTPGQWAGSFQVIAKEPGYIIPKTGTYQYVGKSLLNEDTRFFMYKKCQTILEEAIDKIQNEINASDIANKNPLQLTQEEFNEVQQIRNLMTSLSELVAK